MVHEPLGVRLDPAAPPQRFLPRRERAAHVEDEGQKRPGDGREMNPDDRRPPENEQGTDNDENGVARVQGDDQPRQHPIHHLAGTGAHPDLSVTELAELHQSERVGERIAGRIIRVAGIESDNRSVTFLQDHREIVHVGGIR